MFGDLMGNMEEKQAELKNKLSQFVLQETVGGITITGNAAREITNVSIDDELIENKEKEEIEDLVVVCINNLLKKIEQEEGKASQNLINDILPGMSGLFGK